MCTYVSLQGVPGGCLQSLAGKGGEAFPRGLSVGAVAGGEDFNAPPVFFLVKWNCACCVFLLVSSGIFGEEGCV